MTHGRAGAFLHSTSWRFAEGIVFLTYVGAPDPDLAAPAVPLTIAEVPHSHSATQPHPALLTIEHVAAHAVRHLAFLLPTDPVIQAALRHDQLLSEHLRKTKVTVAGQLR